MKGVKPKRLEIKGKGWTGIYTSGDPGWCLSYFVAHGQASPLSEEQREVLRIGKGRKHSWATGDMYRVEITVRLLKDKRGKFIVKKCKQA